MKIFPVVHIINNDVKQAVNESERAFESGADGVYLIDHYNGRNNTRPLYNTYNRIIERSADRYVGLNILGLSPYGAMVALAKSLEISDGPISAPSGLWIDDMRAYNKDKLAAIELKNSDSRLQKIRLLGGIAFKYTDAYTDDPDMARYETVWLEDSVDVVVTSGKATGCEPSLEKLISMKEIIKGKPLAVASGIDIANIHKYEGIVNEVMVSSSVETTPGSGKFDQLKLSQLIKLAHSLAN